VPDPTTSRRAVAAIILSPLLAAALPASAAQVWTALATEKIRPAAAPRSDATVQLTAARNEFEAFQVVVTGAAGNVRATATDLTGPATIRPPRLFREAIIDLANPSAPDGDTGPWPDGLVPDVDEVVGEQRNAFPFDVPSGESHAVWAEVFVPPGTPSGTYSGQVQVTWDSGSATVPVTLTVWSFTLPSVSSLRSAFFLNYGAIPAEHHVSGDAFYRLRARYGAFALDHRISLANQDDGMWTDLSHLDAYYGPLLSGGAPTQLGGAELTSIEYIGGLTDTSWLSTWAQHGQQNGWLGRAVQYTCDEPPQTCSWSDIPARASAAHASNLRTLVTTSIQQADANGVTSSVDILVPVVNYLDDKPGNSQFSGPQRAAYDDFLAGGSNREVWAYQSCMSHGCGGTNDYFTGWPSYMIDASAIRNRAMEWISFTNRLTGELYYQTGLAYGSNPWVNQWFFSGNGDGTLFYPGTPAQIGGTTDIPVASIRLKMIREGMEDFEYLKLLSDVGDPGLAQQIASNLFPHPYSTEQSPAALMAARDQIARRIVELTGGNDPTPGVPAGTVVGTAPAAPPTLGSLGLPVHGGCAAGDAASLAALAGLLGALRIRRRRR
jgi:Glycoside hydrolase 123, catalytic domain